MFVDNPEFIPFTAKILIDFLISHPEIFGGFMGAIIGGLASGYFFLRNSSK